MRGFSQFFSHTVHVCPLFECNAVMHPASMRDEYVCANGHCWSGLQVHEGDLRRPWRTLSTSTDAPAH